MAEKRLTFNVREAKTYVEEAPVKNSPAPGREKGMKPGGESLPAKTGKEPEAKE